MKTMHRFLALLIVAAFTSTLGAKTDTQKKPRIEVCFVLDTTGSMADLIEGAKQKIWSIANEMISATPTPDLKLGLVAYRDRGDEYVVKSYPLTDDIDSIYGQLRELQAGGGGDTPESVNEALAEAVNKMAWSDDRDVLKIVFLVGDAPPHMDYAQGPKYSEVCRAAVKRDLIVNTVQCGNMGETTPVWQEIAKLGEGSYAAIAQSGNMAVIETPMDAKLAELNKKIGATLIPYGSAPARSATVAKQARAEVAAAPAAADRLSFNVRTRKGVQGGGELLDALESKELRADEVDADKLPAELRRLNKDELKERIAETQQTRAKLQKEIAELARQRDEYIRKETKRLAAKGKGDAFDEKVAGIIREEAKRKGIRYER